MVTGSLFQVLSTGLFDNNDHSLVIKIPLIYAQDDGGEDDGGGSDDGVGDDGGAAESSSDEESSDESE